MRVRWPSCCVRSIVPVSSLTIASMRDFELADGLRQLGFVRLRAALTHPLTTSR